MAIDLKSMSAKQLEKLLGDVKKALTNTRAQDRRKARKAAEKAAAEYGFSLNDLNESEKPARKVRKSKGPKVVSKPKYANPADKSQTWTGKGRQPNWYRLEVGKGTSPASLEI